jgi:uncharacterized protein (TIGR03067 family)
MLAQMKRVCKGDEVTTTMGGEVFMKAKITIAPSKKPKTIDYDMTGGFTKGEKQLGIYEVDRDTFKSCFGKPGAERPTDFTSKPGYGQLGTRRPLPGYRVRMRETQGGLFESIFIFTM